MVERSDLQLDAGHVEADIISHADSTAVETSELAQAQPAAQPAQTAAVANASAETPANGLAVQKVDSYNGVAVKLTVTAEKDKPIVLPADTQIEAILVNGDDLLVREVDGDLILIKGGLKAVPTLVIGDIEIPAEALVASLEAAGVTVPAAGDTGPDANQLSSGGNFGVNPGGIGDAFEIRDLLGFTELNRAFEERREEEGQLEAEQIAPTIISIDGAGTAGSTIGVTLTPTDEGIQNFSSSAVSANATATLLQPHIIGSDLGDILTGDAGDNVLSGGLGNDVLSGGGGDDLLIGGPGADTMTGGAGADTFFYDASAIGSVDSIQDFVSGTDVVDLTELFTVDTAGGQDLGDYARLQAGALQVDTDGATGPETWTTIANITFSSGTTVNILYEDNSNPTDQNGTV